MESSVLNQLNTLPNLLTCSRFILAPILLWLAWQGYETAFFIVLAITFLTDVLDGFTARLLIQSSELSEGDQIITTQLPNAITGLRVEAVND